MHGGDKLLTAYGLAKICYHCLGAPDETGLRALSAFQYHGIHAMVPVPKPDHSNVELRRTAAHSFRCSCGIRRLEAYRALCWEASLTGHIFWKAERRQFQILPLSARPIP